MTLDYDRDRLARMAANRAILASLAVENDIVAMKPKKQTKRRKPDASMKRGPPKDASTHGGESGEDDVERPKKLAKIQNGNEEPTSLRRSARNRGKELNYNDNGDHAVAASRALPRVVSAAAKRAGMEGVPRDSMKRTHDP